MKPYTKIYLDAFGLKPGEFVACEVCEAPAVDIHHIEGRGMGGTSRPDVVQNLMALCRKCHEDYGDRKYLMEYLWKIHLKRMQIAGARPFTGCQHPCSPGDWYKGGRCELNGCYYE